MVSSSFKEFLRIILLCFGVAVSVGWFGLKITNLIAGGIWFDRACNNAHLNLYPIISGVIPFATLIFLILFALSLQYSPDRAKLPPWRKAMSYEQSVSKLPQAYVPPGEKDSSDEDSDAQAIHPPPIAGFQPQRRRHRYRMYSWVPSRSTQPPPVSNFKSIHNHDINTSTSQSSHVPHLERYIHVPSLSSPYRRAMDPNSQSNSWYSSPLRRSRPWERNLSTGIWVTSLILLLASILAGLGWLIYGTILISKSDKSMCFPPLYKLSLATVIIDWTTPVFLSILLFLTMFL